MIFSVIWLKFIRKFDEYFVSTQSKCKYNDHLCSSTTQYHNLETLYVGAKSSLLMEFSFVITSMKF